MFVRALIIEVRFVDGRYHGSGDWPPSPFRLFQALVAGAYGGRWAHEAPDEKDAAFHWLEGLDPPHIAAPPTRAGARVALFVPNNDLDAHGGDPLQIGDVRVRKRLAPRMFDHDQPIVYAWPFANGEGVATTVCSLAERLHTLGLGLDAAYARGETTSWGEAEARLARHRGRVFLPGRGAANGATCPTDGSLDSLEQRHLAAAQRFRRAGKEVRFANIPKPCFRQIAYDSRTMELLFDLIGPEGHSWPYRFDRIVELTEKLRDAAAEKLERASPERAQLIRSVVVGSRASGEADKAARLRITPLPSIGHRHADRAIRRVLIEAPPNCPLPASDIEWAFSGAPIVSAHGEILGELARAAERSMLVHYGADDLALTRHWRTITPAALPQAASRRRMDPARVNERAEQKAGAERAREERSAAEAVRQALRHAGVLSDIEMISVQREPFEVRGARAETFAAPPRFPKERLWHVEVVLAEGRRGPLVIGDGRYLGLGLMAPARREFFDAAIFDVPLEADISVADRWPFLRAVRRATMALARRDDGAVATLFSGHEPGGAKASSGHHRHVFFAAADLDRDGRVDTLMAAAPWACDRSASPEAGEPTEFDSVVSQIGVVRAGRIGIITVSPSRTSDTHAALMGPSRVWESATPYNPTSHARRHEDKADAAARDAIAECLRRGLPQPGVEVLDFVAGPNSGNCGVRLRLSFSVAVDGPILIGQNSHSGGGLFTAVLR